MHNPGTGCLLILGLVICAAIGLAIETIWGKLLLACSVVVLLIGWFYHHPKLRGNEQNQRIVAVWLAGMLILAGGMIGYAHLGDKQQAEKAAQPKQEAKKADYEGYINKDSFFCDDYETLIRLSDALQKKDKDLMSQLALEGKIHKVSKDTKVSIIDTGTLDKNAVSVVIEEGRYDLKSGYTFKDWTRRR
jgi:hypothetical protein